MTSDSRAALLVAYPFLMHYRRAVFLELDKAARIDCTFAADVTGRLGIETFSSTELKRFVRTRQRIAGKFQWQGGLIRLALVGRFDAAVFLGDWAYLSTWMAAIILRIRRRRVLFWTIGWHRPERGVRRVVRNVFYRLANELLLYGNVAKEIGVLQGYPVERMRVIFNSVEPQEGTEGLERVVDQLEAAKCRTLIGAVIRLNAVKHLELVIDAAAIVNTKGFNIAVAFAGDGPARESLVARAIAKNVPLILTGAIYERASIEAFYSRLSVCVVPSAIGLTAIQSLAHGVPVVSDDDRFSQMPEWEAIRPGINGSTFRKGDVEGLAEAIAEWVSRTRAQGPRIAALCRAEVQARWNAAAQAARIEEAIDELLQ